MNQGSFLILAAGAQSVFTCIVPLLSRWISLWYGQASLRRPFTQAIISMVSGQSGPALYPLAEQTLTMVISSDGSVNHSFGSENNSMFPVIPARSNNMGAAAAVPVSPGLPSPSALPAQTAITYPGVVPTAQASRKPKLVPVFHAIVPDEEKNCHPDSPSGLLTFLRAS